jgi:hypothetical protein
VGRDVGAAVGGDVGAAVGGDVGAAVGSDVGGGGVADGGFGLPVLGPDTPLRAMASIAISPCQLPPTMPEIEKETVLPS